VQDLIAAIELDMKHIPLYVEWFFYSYQTCIGDNVKNFASYKDFEIEEETMLVEEQRSCSGFKKKMPPWVEGSSPQHMRNRDEYH
jgi:hypothetical protein